MPIVLSKGKIRIYVYPNDHGRAHVLVRLPDGEFKVELAEMTVVAISKNLKAADLKCGLELIEENIEMLWQSWDEHNDG